MLQLLFSLSFSLFFFSFFSFFFFVEKGQISRIFPFSFLSFKLEIGVNEVKGEMAPNNSYINKREAKYFRLPDFRPSALHT